MNNKTSLVVSGIALVGLAIYFMSPGIQPDKSPAAPDKSARTGSGNAAATAEPSLPKEHASPRKSADYTGGNTVASPAAAPAQQQASAPALEPEIRKALGKLLNTSSEGLVEETRNGATRVDLRGRFQTAPVATIDAQGNVQITDYSYLPEASTPP